VDPEWQSEQTLLAPTNDAGDNVNR